jgi:hypothetical protein
MDCFSKKRPAPQETAQAPGSMAARAPPLPEGRPADTWLWRGASMTCALGLRQDPRLTRQRGTALRLRGKCRGSRENPRTNYAAFELTSAQVGSGGVESVFICAGMTRASYYLARIIAT